MKGKQIWFAPSLGFFRESLGLPKDLMAKAMSISPGLYDSYESGKLLIPFHIAKRLDKLYYHWIPYADNWWTGKYIQLRKELGIKCDELSLAIKEGRSCVQNLEHNGRRPNIYIIIKIHNYLVKERKKRENQISKSRDI